MPPSFRSIHPLSYETEDGYRSHEQDRIVELLGALALYLDSIACFATDCSPRYLPLLVVGSGFNEEPSEIGKVGLASSQQLCYVFVRTSLCFLDRSHDSMTA